MKKMRWLGFIVLLFTMFTVSEFNTAFTPPLEVVYESVVELENCENKFDPLVPFIITEMLLPSIEPKMLYSYECDSILFDISKEFFRPPSLT